jgi:putative transposase
MAAVTELANDVGTNAACQALCLPRASYYRDRRKTSFLAVTASRPSPARALHPVERETVLACLHEERFQDRSPAAVYATLLDEGQYHCSIRTMYRLLQERGESRERRDQLTHPPYKKPELLATAPNQLWSWDITKLLGPAKWTYFYLYVILDVFSRYVTGWMVAMRESAELAKRLIEESCKKQCILPGQLTLHADRGTSMSSKPVAFLLADLGVTKTHSRPHVSDDNPYSESQFRTMKYRPEFPDRFGCIQTAGPSRRDSFFGTTRNTATLGWLCSPRRWFTTRAAPERSRCGLSSSPGTLRSTRSQTTFRSDGGLDQQTSKFR